MPQKPAGFIPDGFEPDKPSGFEDDLKAVREHVDAGNDVPHSLVSRILDWLPTAGGAVGGFVAGVPGAAIGGAAGEGLKTTAQHITEIPGAIADVSRNLIAHPNETVQGGLAGMREGGMNAFRSGVEQGSGEGIGRAVMGVAVPAVKRLAGATMQSAVKPGAATTARAIARGVSSEDLPVIKTLLEEKVNVSTGGLDKLRKIISGTNKDIEDILTNSPGKIYPESAAKRAEDLIPKYQTQVNPRADVADVTNSVDEFLGTRPGAPQRPLSPMSMLEAQKLKTGTYRSLTEKAYGEVRAPAIEAQKAIARGLKEDIEAEAKKAGIDIGKMNMREGNAIQTLEAVAKRLAVKGNTDPISLAWLANNSAAGLGFVVSRSPAVKSMIARGMYKPAVMAARLPPWFTPNVLRTMVQSVASSNEQESQ